MAWDVDDLQVEVSEVEQSLSSVAVKVLDLTEVCQVLVISEDLYRKWEVMKVMSPQLQDVDDGKKFTVVDIIVLLCGDKQLEEVGARVPVIIQVSLEENCARGILEGISVETIDISYLILSSDLIIYLITLRSYAFVIHHMIFIQMTDEHCSCFAIGQ